MITLTKTLTVSGNYTLTDDILWTRKNGGAIVAVGPTTIDLNGHRIIGVGGSDNISIGIFANNQSNVTVKNGTVSGFNIGVNMLDSVALTTAGYSQSNNSILNMTIQNCRTNGFQLGGNNCLVDNTVITNIGIEGTDLSRAFGGQFFGPNATFSNSIVTRLNGGSESVGVSFTSRGNVNVNAAVINSTLDGSKASGQSFGIWHSYGDVEITGSYIANWDYPIGSLDGNKYGSTIFANNGVIYGIGTDLGGNTFIPHFRHTPGDDAIIGDKTEQRFLGGAGNDFIVGMGGNDHLYGNEGSDIFAYIIPPSVFDKDVVMDLYQAHGDRLAFAREIFGAAADENGKPRLQHGENATGDKATFLQYDLAYTLYFDPDGGGSAQKIPIAYIPYMILDPSDLFFLDATVEAYTFKKFATSWQAQPIGDFNNDGNADILWHYQAGGGYLSEWLMFDGLRAAPFGLHAMPTARVIAAADLNGDGTTDLLWRDQNDQVVSWFMSRGQFVTNWLYGNLSGWELSAAGDFNGDGIDDLMWQGAQGQMSAWFLFNGVSTGTNTNLPNMLGAKAKAGDFDGDGTDDVLWQQPNGTRFIWMMDNGQRAATLYLPAMREWTNLAVGDFDGDGTDDLLWRHDTSGALLAWEMDDGRAAGTTYLGQSAGLEFLGVGDVNGDGKDDLFWRNPMTADIKTWLL